MSQGGSGHSATAVFLKRAGLVLSAATGLTVLAFCAGFLARRAQFEIADIPFVFVDYWAYAETGFLGLVHSAYLVLESPGPIAMAVVVTIGLFLALEWKRFREFVFQPWVAFVGSVLVIAVLAVLVRQQITVLGTSALLVGGKPSSDEERRVEIVAPFSWFVPDALVPKPLPVDFPQDAAEGWDMIARELELRAARAPTSMEVRPLPGWISLVDDDSAPVDRDDAYRATAETVDRVAVAKDGPLMGPDDATTAVSDEIKRPSTLIGLFAPIEQTEAHRAHALYKALTIWAALSVWLVAILHIWLKRVPRELPGSKATPGPGIPGLIVRLQEEIWFSCWYVIRPLSLVLVLVSGFFLVPECFGALALPNIGEERVEVVLKKSRSGEEEPNKGGADESPGGDNHSERGELIKFVQEANKYHFSDIDEQRGLEDKWTSEVARIAENASEESQRLLRRIASASRQTAPRLSAIPYDAWIRMSSQLGTSRVGHILYYPRSEGEYLRLLTRHEKSGKRSWTILPIKSDNILEVRVADKDEDRQLAYHLRQMRSLDADSRNEAIIELELLGHPNTLEVMLATIFDRSPTVQGPAITAAGRCAASLPRTPVGNLRRVRAAEILLRVVEDPSKPEHFRGSAATALYVFADAECADAPDRLLRILRDPDMATQDPNWVIRGTVITALAKMHHQEAVESLLQILDWSKNGGFHPEPPVSIRRSVPSALSIIGGAEAAVPDAARMLNDSATSPVLHGPLISLLGALGSRGDGHATSALIRYIQAPRREGVSDERFLEVHGAAMLSLRLIGDPEALSVLHRVVRKGEARDEQELPYGDQVRGAAILALRTIDDPSSEAPLIQLAEEGSVGSEVRAIAAIVLGEIGGAAATEALRELGRSQIAVAEEALRDLDDLGIGRRKEREMLLERSSDVLRIVKAVEIALSTRGESGSGRAQAYAAEITALREVFEFSLLQEGFSAWLGEE